MVENLSNEPLQQVDNPTPQQSLFQSKFFIGTFLLVVAAIVAGSLWIFATVIIPQRQKQQETVQKFLESQQKKGELVRKVNDIITKIQNPDPNLIAQYQPVPDLMKVQQDNTVYGAKPDTIVGEQQFLPNSLTGVRAAIQEGNYALARERIIKVFPEVKHTFLTQDRHNPDDVYLQKPELEILDPEQIFAPTSKLDRNVRRLLVSAVKKDAVIETIKLYYILGSLK